MNKGQTSKGLSYSVSLFLLALFFITLNINFISAFNFEGDGVKIIDPVDKYGNVEIAIQDQHSEIIDYYIGRVDGTTNPSSAVYIDEVNVTVDSTTGAVQYQAINIIEEGHYYQAVVLAINGNVITTNVPFDYNFTTNAIVEFSTWNMNVDGSTGTQEFEICAPAGVAWDITRILFSIGDDSAMDSTTFGGIPSLPNGVVLRMVNGHTKNIFVVNDNGGFAERAYDVTYDDRRSPLGEYAVRVRRTFAGQEKNGVTIRLDGDEGDCLKILIQDDLTDLTKFASVVQGHVVE